MKSRVGWLLLATVIAGCADGRFRENSIGSSPDRAYKDRAFTEFFRRTNGWVSGDGAISVPLSDGRVLWLFGDSHLDDFDPKSKTTPCLFQSRNAALVQKTKTNLRDAETLRTYGPIFWSWFKNTTNKDLWFWPACGFQRSNAVFVYLFSLKKTGEGMWGFGSAGDDYWGKVEFPSMKIVNYIPLPSFKGLQMGQGFVADGDWIYAFGAKAKKLSADVVVARFKADEPTRWMFWNGTNWNGSPANTTAIDRASVGVHVCYVRGKYVLTSGSFSIASDQGRDIFMATADKPTGPFTSLKKVWTVDDKYKGHYPFWYMAQAHPEFINERNEILVTYSINGYEPAVKTCVNGRANPDHYRPKAIRVPLKMLGID
jgi:hypothetical protein